MEASRKHGSFDTRWPGASRGSSRVIPTAAPLRAEEAADGLDWAAFSSRYFAGRRRHDSEVRAAYIAYAQGCEWRTAPARLRLVPGDPPPAPVEWQPDEAATRRLVAAMAARPAPEA